MITARGIAHVTLTVSDISRTRKFYEILFATNLPMEKVIHRLNEMGVSNAGLERFAGKYPYICFRDPDNIQTEFFIPQEM